MQAIGRRAAAAFVGFLILASGQDAAAGAVRPGFDASTLPANDDASTGLTSIGFEVDFFGVSFTGLFVNNNGNVTFDSALGAFTPFDLTSTGRQIIAPFFADVDTTGAGLEVTYGAGTVDGRLAFGANWLDVDYFSATDPDHVSKLNSFQVVLIDRSDIAGGDFDFEFNYDAINWETGDASGGVEGLGGDSARAGFSNGSGDPGTAFEITGSAVNGAFLDGNAVTGLIHNRLNSDVDGRYIFEVRNGTVVVPVVPEPASLVVFGLALAGFAGAMRKRKTA